MKMYLSAMGLLFLLSSVSGLAQVQTQSHAQSKKVSANVSLPKNGAIVWALKILNAVKNDVVMTFHRDEMKVSDEIAKIVEAYRHVDYKKIGEESDRTNGDPGHPSARGK